MIEATEESAIIYADLIDLPPDKAWGQGRISLLGDAAHATTPNMGQGACQALEDAVVLADALRNSQDPVIGLRAYEDRRRERALWVVRQSWRIGRVFQWQNRLAVWLRNQLTRTKFAHRQGVKVFEKALRVELPDL